VVAWFGLRQEETLKIENKKRFSGTVFLSGAQEFFSIKKTVIYTMVSGLIGGCFFVYLSTSKQIFQDQYGLTVEFGYVFAALAFSMGMASFMNSSLVLRFGMKKLATFFLVLFCISSMSYILLSYNTGNPSLPVIMVFFAIQFLGLGFIFGNVRSLAMEPIGHIAGVGAAVNGFISTLLSVPIAIFIGSFITDSALPIFIGFFVCSLVSLLLILLVKKNGTTLVKINSKVEEIDDTSF
jgi:DHA1 family bicyclomycin/chloramphenicol resistance-like MFS transporter